MNTNNNNNYKQIIIIFISLQIPFSRLSSMPCVGKLDALSLLITSHDHTTQCHLTLFRGLSYVMLL